MGGLGISLCLQPLHVFPIVKAPLCPLREFFESGFLVRRRERRVSGGLFVLRTGPANIVYSCPETESDVYVNQGQRLQKGRGDGREGEEGGSVRGSTKGGACKNAKPWFASAGS